MVIQTDAIDEDKELVFRVNTMLFIRGIGGFGNKGSVKLDIPKAPKRAADHRSEEKTQPN